MRWWLRVKHIPNLHCPHHHSHYLVHTPCKYRFYIEKILGDIGRRDIEAHAAQVSFHPECLRVQYIGPDGNPLESDFKEAYVNLFLAEGYRVIYIGNGASDVSPARRSHHVFATGDLLARFRTAGLNCTPFTDFNEVIQGIEGL